MDRLLTAMKVFVASAQAGNFSLAARRLELSTGTVSAMIRGLENHLGIRLINRTTRRMHIASKIRSRNCLISTLLWCCWCLPVFVVFRAYCPSLGCSSNPAADVSIQPILLPIGQMKKGRGISAAFCMSGRS